MDFPKKERQTCSKEYGTFRSCMSPVNYLKRKLALGCTEVKPSFPLNEPHTWERTYVKSNAPFEDGPVESRQFVSQTSGQDFKVKQGLEPLLKEIDFCVINRKLQTGGTVRWNPNIQNSDGGLTHPASSTSRVDDGPTQSKRVKFFSFSRRNSSAAISNDDTYNKTSANHPNIIVPSSQTKDRLTQKNYQKGTKFFRQEQEGDRSC